jgi:hypothetical protein
VICRLEARQVEKTKITVDTRAAFIIIQGNPLTGPERITQALDLFTGLCRDYLAAPPRTPPRAYPGGCAGPSRAALRFAARGRCAPRGPLLRTTWTSHPAPSLEAVK